MSTLETDLVQAATGTNTALKLKGKGSGVVKIGDGELSFPDADGSSDQIIKTDGSGALSFADAGGGFVKQVVSMQTGAYATGTTLTPFDDTIPQIGNGTEFMTLAITPQNSSNRLIIEALGVFASSIGAARVFTMHLHKDAVADALAATSVWTSANEQPNGLVIRHVMVAGTTDEITFRIRAGLSASATIRFNGRNGRSLGGSMNSGIVITEIEP